MNGPFVARGRAMIGSRPMAKLITDKQRKAKARRLKACGEVVVRSWSLASPPLRLQRRTTGCYGSGRPKHSRPPGCALSRSTTAKRPVWRPHGLDSATSAPWNSGPRRVIA